jgi:monoamine oxidase
MAPRDIKPSTRFVDSPNLVDPVWYSNAVSVSGEKRLVLTSGQTGQLKDGSWPGTFAGQVKQAVTNLVHALNAAGVSAREIIKITFYPVDWSLELGQDLMTPVLKLLADDYGVENRPLTTLVPVAKLAHPESKFEIEAVAVAGGSADHWTNDSGVQEHVLSPTEMDVVVVGGGFSGLAAAYRCQEAGLRAMLLEAKHRVGGRSRTQERSSGPGVIELGATWINKTTQPEAYALTQMFGLETVTQYTDGDAVFQRPDGTIVRGAEAEMENVSRSTYTPDKAKIDDRVQLKTIACRKKC